MNPDSIPAHAEQGHALRWPPERFYWSILPAAYVRAPGVLPPVLMDQLLREVPLLSASHEPAQDDAHDASLDGEPVTPDEPTHLTQACPPLHAVCVPLPGQRVLACAIDADELQQLAPIALSLRPLALPNLSPLADVPASALDELELLVGIAEPSPIRRARCRRHALLAGAALLLACAASLWLLRSAHAMRSLAQRAEGTAHAARAATAALAPSDTHALYEQLRLLRSPDATQTLHDLLAAWPTSLSPPTSIALDAFSISASVVASGAEAEQQMLAAFDLPSPWTTAEPSVASTPAGSASKEQSNTQLVVQLRWTRPQPSTPLDRSTKHP